MRTKPLLLMSSVFLVLGLVLAPLAVAGKKPQLVKNGVIHACLVTKGKKSQRGTIHVVSSAAKCNKKKGEQALTWGVAGPAGANGAPGPAGVPGANGTTGGAGATGATGAQGEKGSSAVIENSLKETIVQQGKTIELLTNEVETLTGG